MAYNLNETMRFLGKQDYGSILNKDIFALMDDIFQARPGEFTKEAAMDLFMLGYIHGKSEEHNG